MYEGGASGGGGGVRRLSTGREPGKLLVSNLDFGVNESDIQVCLTCCTVAFYHFDLCLLINIITQLTMPVVQNCKFIFYRS